VDSAGTMRTVAGTGQAGFADGPAATSQLDRPWGIAVDGGQPRSLYVADSLNERVRAVRGSTVETVAGTGTTGASGDTGDAAAAELNVPHAVDAIGDAGSLFVADTSNGLVRRVAPG
jgi:hypothetical protein